MKTPRWSRSTTAEAAELICPVCSEPLSDAGGSLVCPRRHTFDRAREGYVDLLPAGYGRRGIEGDTAAMVAARRRFLAAGHYAPLVDAILALTVDTLGRGSFPVGSGPLVLDAGCGEGYYGGTVADALRAKYGACRLYGLDISRAALRLAARTYDGVFFLNDVGSRICVADGAADLLLDIFAPRNGGEFARVLRPGGIAIVVIPDESHLHELRGAVPLLSIPPEKRERTMDQLSAHLAIHGESAVAFAMRLARPDLRDLVRMSPSAHHLEDAQLEGLRDMDVTASFRILRFENRSSTRSR